MAASRDRRLWNLWWISFLKRHFEALLVCFLLVFVAAVVNWVPDKYAFLNFFYLPVLTAGYLLGARRSILTSVLCALMVLLYYLWSWMDHSLAMGQGIAGLPAILGREWQTLVSLTIWGSFLVLTGGTFGIVNDRMLRSRDQIRNLNVELDRQAGELQERNTALEATTTELKSKAVTMQDLNQALQSSSQELEVRAAELQEKTLLIERLKSETEKTLYSAMDPTVARMIAQRRLRQEKRVISTLFCDLKNFTSFSDENPPEVVLDELNKLYEIMEDVVETYHGHIDKILGDGMMCEFGAPIDFQQHSLQAVVAALKMQETFQERKQSWQLRVGISTGEAIVGLMGSRRRGYSALGKVVNVAKRLEEICEPGSVYIGENVYQGVKAFVDVEPVRSFPKNRTEDGAVLDVIAEKEQQILHDPQNADLLFEVGKLCFQIREASKALEYFGRALKLKPWDTDLKVAYADATMNRDEFEKVTIRGIEKKQFVYRAVRMKNTLLNRNRFPEVFHNQYRHVENMIEIPESVPLTVEVIDGTVGHSLGVAVVAYAIADRLGLPAETKKSVLIAARLQDLGKSGVWHHILNRRGGLSDNERRELEGHVAESVSIARRMGYEKPEVLEIIENHHELLNGEGYPRRKKGPEIPLAGRINCVADVYCALTSWRSFRESWDVRVALGELRKGATAGMYDPMVVDTLCELMNQSF